MDRNVQVFPDMYKGRDLGFMRSQILVAETNRQKRAAITSILRRNMAWFICHAGTPHSLSLTASEIADMLLLEGSYIGVVRREINVYLYEQEIRKPG